MKKLLTGQQQDLADKYVMRMIRRCRANNIPLSRAEIERAKVEAEELVFSGDITAADLQPVKFEIEDSQLWKYQAYVTPIKESAIY